MVLPKKDLIEDVVGVSWKDPLFLRSNKLSPGNVLYYFSLSKFFDIHSINQIAVSQNLPPEGRR